MSFIAEVLCCFSSVLFLFLTCVPELLVAIHGEDNQQVAQDVHHDGEDEKTAQSCGDPRRAAQRGVTGLCRRRVVQVRLIYNHCTQLRNFPPLTWAQSQPCTRAPPPRVPKRKVDAGGSKLSPLPGFILFLPLFFFSFFLSLSGSCLAERVLAARLGLTPAPACHSLFVGWRSLTSKAFPACDQTQAKRSSDFTPKERHCCRLVAATQKSSWVRALLPSLLSERSFIHGWESSKKSIH